MTTLTQKIDARVEMARTVTLRGIRWTEAKNNGARVWSTEVIDLDDRSIPAAAGPAGTGPRR